MDRNLLLDFREFSLKFSSNLLSFSLHFYGNNGTYIDVFGFSVLFVPVWADCNVWLNNSLFKIYFSGKVFYSKVQLHIKLSADRYIFSCVVLLSAYKEGYLVNIKDNRQNI